LATSGACDTVFFQQKERGENDMQGWGRTLAFLLLLASVVPAAAMDYPTRTIRVISSIGAGGLADILIRAMAHDIGAAHFGTVIVENRPGAGGTVGARTCAEAAPDGYTICMIQDVATVINPIIEPIAGFDPAKQLAPITRLFYFTNLFAVNASLHVKSFAELAAYAKAHPKTLNYMAPSISEVAFMAKFNKEYGTDMVRVPFRGGGDAINAMLTGTTQIAIFGIGNLMPYIKAGKIVGLAVDSAKRSPVAPDIPTLKELGLNEHALPTSFGIYAPAGTPRAIIDKLYKIITAVGSKPEFENKYLIERGLTPAFDSPDEYAKGLVADRVDALAVVKASGLYPNVR
jgi:tripartite-type tricarboxylate transporter receptor subunit TctC